jgi:hypothetical protein
MAAAHGRNPAMIDPSPELPDDMSIANVELPPKLQQALTAAGLRTVGDVREAPDTKILRIPDLGRVRWLCFAKPSGCPLLWEFAAMLRRYCQRTIIETGEAAVQA